MTVFFMINTLVFVVLVMYVFVYYQMHKNLKTLATLVEEIQSPKPEWTSPTFKSSNRLSKSVSRAHSSSEVRELEAEL